METKTSDTIRGNHISLFIFWKLEELLEGDKE